MNVQEHFEKYSAWVFLNKVQNTYKIVQNNSALMLFCVMFNTETDGVVITIPGKLAKHSEQTREENSTGVAKRKGGVLKFIIRKGEFH